MPSFRVPSLLRLALAGALVASLGLAGCGRKGPLDPPPGASLDGAAPARATTMTSPIGVTPIGSGSQSKDDGGMGPDGRPMAPKGPDRPIFLDRLLN